MPKYRKLSRRDILREGDQYQTESGSWMAVWEAPGGYHSIGNHPWPGVVYRRPVAFRRYKKLSARDVLRWNDQWRTESGRWLEVYGPAIGSRHTVGRHPDPKVVYRRPTESSEK